MSDQSYKTPAEQIWEEIKDKPINLFSLPGKKVFNFCQPKMVEPSKLYLIYNITSFLPALETALGNDYNVELMLKYLVVSKITKLL